MKTGLVLEGGAVRGIYTAGVLDVLYENNLFPDGVIGVSAGSIHGCSYLSCQPGRSIRYYIKFCKDWRFMSIKSLLLTGDVVNEQFCYHDIPETLDPFDNASFEKTVKSIPFYAVATDLKTGKPVYQRVESLRGEKIDMVRASSSMPLASKIVKIGDQLLLDGGVSDSIPLKAFQDMGYEKNIVVLTQTAGYQKKPMNMTLAKRLYRDYPLFLKAMQERYINYNESLKYVEEQEKAGRIIVIRPSHDLHVKRMDHDPAKIRAQYELGRKDAAKKLEQIKSNLI